MNGFSVKRIWLWQAVAVVLLNLTIKGLFLASPILGMDEPFTLFRVQQSYSELINLLASNNHPPLFESIMWLWHRVVGYNTVLLRCVPLVFSSMAAGVLFLMARHHFNSFTAWFSALAFTLSNPYFYFSHEIRAYSLVSLLVFCSLWIFLNWQKNPQNKYVVTLAVFNALLLYTHYFGIFVIAAQVLSIFLTGRKRLLLQILFSLGLTVLTYIPQILMVYGRWVKKVSKGHWLDEPGVEALYNMLSKFFNIPAGAALALILVSFSVYKIIKQKKPEFFLFILLFPGVYVAMWVVSQELSIFHDRYVSIAFNGIFILLAFGISEFSKKWKIPLAALMCALLLSQLQLKPNHGQKTHELTNDIKNLRAEDEIPVYIYPAWSYQCFSYHYDLKSFKNYGKTTELLKEKNIFFTYEKDALKKAGLHKEAIVVNFEGKLENAAKLTSDYKDYGKQSLMYLKN